MRLVYTATQKPVQIGDTVVVDGTTLVVDHAPKPHKAESEGKVSLRVPGNTDVCGGPTYYVSIIGAEWIEREDRDPELAVLVPAQKAIVGGNWFAMVDGVIWGGPMLNTGEMALADGGPVEFHTIDDDAKTAANAALLALTGGDRAAALAAVMENEEIDQPDAEKLLNADKLVALDLRGWFCLDDGGSLYGGPLNADGTLNYEEASGVDMPERFEYPELVREYEDTLRAALALRIR